ncbi:MAG: holdfast anchoring protein HfaA [Caulobacteraceae bacterium]
MHRDNAAARRRTLLKRLVLAGSIGAGTLALSSAALAQSASSTLSAFKAGYGGTGLSGFEQPVNVNTRDANGNLVITDGVIQAGADNSVFSHLSVGGASDTFSGAGAMGSATAIGNNLSVNVSGNNNTVVVNATQTNTGNISATTTLNGKVNLDGGQ